MKCGMHMCIYKQNPSPGLLSGSSLSTELLTFASVEAETLDARCIRLREELTTAEFDRLKQSYIDQSKEDLVSGSVGPLYYATVVIEKIPVRALGTSRFLNYYHFVREV